MKRVFDNLRGKAATLERRAEHLESRLASRQPRGEAYDRQEISALRAAIAALDVVEKARAVTKAYADEETTTDEDFDGAMIRLAEALDASTEAE